MRQAPFRVTAAADEQLQTVLEAHDRYERLRQRRERLVHLLAVLGTFLWLGTVWHPDLVERLAAVAAGAWPIGLALTLATAVGEWRWYRRRVDASRGVRRHGAGGAP